MTLASNGQAAIIRTERGLTRTELFAAPLRVSVAGRSPINHPAIMQRPFLISLINSSILDLVVFQEHIKRTPPTPINV